MTDIEKRLRDAEIRIDALEKRVCELLWGGNAELIFDLLSLKADSVSKTRAAEILGVTRATIYAMMADGRLDGICGGKKVSLDSIRRFAASPGVRGSRFGIKNKKEEVNGSDTLEEA